VLATSVRVTVAACGGALLLYALLYRADDVMPWPVVLLGIAYAIPLFVRGSGIDEGAPQVARSMQHPHNFGPVVQGAVENHVTTVGEAAQTQGKLVAGAAGERV